MNPNEFVDLCRRLRELGVTQVVAPGGYQASWLGAEGTDAQHNGESESAIGFMVAVDECSEDVEVDDG